MDIIVLILCSLFWRLIRGFIVVGLRDREASEDAYILSPLATMEAKAILTAHR